MQSDSMKDDLRNCGCDCDCDCNCGCNCGPVPSVSALNSVNVATQTVASQGLVLFNLNRVSVGCSINHTPSTGVFSLAGPGVYQVSFSAVVAIPAATPVTAISLVYNLDGREVPGTELSVTPSAAGELHTVATTSVIEVLKNMTSVLMIVNNGTNPVEISQANVSIIKLG